MKYLPIFSLAILIISCWQAPEETNLDTTQLEQNSIPDEVVKQPIGKGKITTIADGFDVQRVNLWSSTIESRITTTYLTKDESVNILRDEDPYYFVETANGDGRKGYCMKAFVIKDK